MSRAALYGQPHPLPVNKQEVFQNLLLTTMVVIATTPARTPDLGRPVSLARGADTEVLGSPLSVIRPPSDTVFGQYDEGTPRPLKVSRIDPTGLNLPILGNVTVPPVAQSDLSSRPVALKLERSDTLGQPLQFMLPNLPPQFQIATEHGARPQTLRPVRTDQLGTAYGVIQNLPPPPQFGMETGARPQQLVKIHTELLGSPFGLVKEAVTSPPRGTESTRRANTLTIASFQSEPVSTNLQRIQKDSPVQPGYIVVPQFVGMLLTYAAQQAADLGFTNILAYQRVSNQFQGIVIAQNYAYGSVVPANIDLTFTVAEGSVPSNTIDERLIPP